MGNEKLKDSDIVPSGVAELAKLQSEGYAYKTVNGVTPPSPSPAREREL